MWGGVISGGNGWASHVMSKWLNTAGQNSNMNTGRVGSTVTYKEILFHRTVTRDLFGKCARSLQDAMCLGQYKNVASL